MLFLALIALSLIPVYLVGIRSKDAKVYLTIFYIINLFILSVMCTNFMLMKFVPGNQLVFPDEYLYVNDHSSTLLFSYYVRFLDDYFDLDVVRSVNIFVFSLSMSMLSSEIISRVTGHYRQVMLGFAILGSVVGGYWAFFILKEAFSVAALCLLVIAHLKSSKIYFLMAGLLLAFARIELLTLYFAVSILFVMKCKFKPLYYLSFLIAVILFITFMNSDMSYALKLFTLSRRFGENEFQFDDVAINMSHLKLLPFIVSEPFRQALITNINSTFNPLIELQPFVFMQRIFNLFSFIVFLICVRRYLFKDKLVLFAFIIVIGVLCTHSVYRYINTILIPLTLYFIYLLWLVKQRALF